MKFLVEILKQTQAHLVTHVEFVLKAFEQIKMALHVMNVNNGIIASVLTWKRPYFWNLLILKVNGTANCAYCHRLVQTKALKVFLSFLLTKMTTMTHLLKIYNQLEIYSICQPWSKGFPLHT